MSEQEIDYGEYCVCGDELKFHHPKMGCVKLVDGEFCRCKKAEPRNGWYGCRNVGHMTTMLDVEGPWEWYDWNLGGGRHRIVLAMKSGIMRVVKTVIGKGKASKDAWIIETGDMDVTVRSDAEFRESFERCVSNKDMSDPVSYELDRLGEIFELQQGFTEMLYKDNLYWRWSQNEKVNNLCTAAIHEVVELQRLTNWKWWKKPSGLKYADAKEELIDVWHFVVQLSIVLGLSPEDILAEYRRKNEINRERQRSGY